jgi:hypothetical protein
VAASEDDVDGEAVGIVDANSVADAAVDEEGLCVDTGLEAQPASASCTSTRIDLVMARIGHLLPCAAQAMPSNSGPASGERAARIALAADGGRAAEA